MDAAARRPRASSAASSAALRCDAEGVELAVDGGGGEAVRRREDHEREASRSAERAHVLARAGHQRAPGRDLRGDVAAERARRAAAAAPWSATPAAWAASRSAAAASPEPPPMPAATGTRLRIVSRCGGASQPVAARKAASAAPARFSPSTPGQTTSSAVAPARGLERQLVGERDRLDDRDERVQAVLARRADVEAEVDLARGEAAQPHASLACSSRHCSGASVSARASAGRPERLERGADRVAVAALERDASARAPCGGARSPAGRARAAARARGAGPVRSRRTSTESTLGTGKNTFRETGRITFTSHASWASTRRDPVGGRARARGEALADLLLHHRHPRGDLGQQLDRAQDHRRGDAVGQVGDDLRRRRVERGEVELDRVGEVQRDVRVRVERVAQRRPRAARSSSTTWTWRGALGEVLGEHAEAAADLEHDVVAAPSSAAREITSSRFESIRKFWPSSRFGRIPNAFMRRRLGCAGRLAHQPNSRAALASTAASSSS